jgi:hypothetical protein
MKGRDLAPKEVPLFYRNTAITRYTKTERKDRVKFSILLIGEHSRAECLYL